MLTRPTQLRDTAELAAVEIAAPLRIVACAARTDQGARRRLNEDGMLVAGQLVAVADGVGGNRAGEDASALALDVLRREVQAFADDPEAELRRAVEAANAAVRAAASDAAHGGMATTIVAALIGPAAVTVAHVGDSRAYLLDDGRLAPLTRDHSLAAALVAGGELDPGAMRRHPMRSVILRAVGLDTTVQPDVATVPAKSGDLLVLCSDGLTGAVDPAQLERLAAGEHDLDRLVQQLAAAATRAGGGDDITVVAARLGRPTVGDVTR